MIYINAGSVKSTGSTPQDDQDSRSIPRTAWPAVAMKLELVDAAAVIGDLAAPPGNRLEALKGDPQDDYSIRVNRQFRITFRFRDGDAYGVRCEDHH